MRHPDEAFMVQAAMRHLSADIDGVLDAVAY